MHRNPNPCGPGLRGDSPHLASHVPSDERLTASPCVSDCMCLWLQGTTLHSLLPPDAATVCPVGVGLKCNPHSVKHFELPSLFLSTSLCRSQRHYNTLRIAYASIGYTPIAWLSTPSLCLFRGAVYPQCLTIIALMPRATAVAALTCLVSYVGADN